MVQHCEFKNWDSLGEADTRGLRLRVYKIKHMFKKDRVRFATSVFVCMYVQSVSYG